MSVKSKGLGRGLDALLAVRTPLAQTATSASSQATQGDQIQQIDIHAIQVGRYQPRLHMDDEALDALAASIRAQGIIQPIVLRQNIGSTSYELIAGERRWRAAQRAGLDTIPAIVRILADETVLAVALIENIQREALDPIEEARGFRRLADEFQLTHEQIATAIGRSRTAVSNALRLLSLPDIVQEMVHTRQLEMGHARALLSLPTTEQIHVAHDAISKAWTVRDVERRVQDIIRGATPMPSYQAPPKADPNIQSLAQKLSDLLGTSVSLQHQPKGAGTLSIRYSTLDELDRLLERMQCSLEQE